MVYGPFHSSTGEYQLGGLSRRVVAAPGSAPLDAASSEGGLVEDDVRRGIRDEDLDEVVVAVERRGKGDQVSGGHVAGARGGGAVRDARVDGGPVGRSTGAPPP